MSQPTYPLSSSLGDQLKSASGRALGEISLDAVAQGLIDADDLQVSAETLRQQAQIAESAGFPQLSENLSRAAELTAVPNDVLLQMYDKLRPGRSSFAELEALAETLNSQYQAVQTAAFVREAAQVYKERKLVSG